MAEGEHRQGQGPHRQGGRRRPDRRQEPEERRQGRPRRRQRQERRRQRHRQDQGQGLAQRRGAAHRVAPRSLLPSCEGALARGAEDLIASATERLRSCLVAPVTPSKAEAPVERVLRGHAGAVGEPDRLRALPVVRCSRRCRPGVPLGRSSRPVDALMTSFRPSCRRVTSSCRRRTRRGPSTAGLVTCVIDHLDLLARERAQVDVPVLEAGRVTARGVPVTRRPVRRARRRLRCSASRVM